MAVSGLTNDLDDLVLSGAEIYIDDDTLPSGTINEETTKFSAEFVELFAGKGIKVRVAKKMKSMGIAFGATWYNITPKAISIFYGGNYSVGVGTTIVDYKNAVVAPTAHKFTIAAQTVEGKAIDIIFYNAVNALFGDLPTNGQDFANFPFEIVPEPINPGDAAEVLVRIEKED